MNNKRRTFKQIHCSRPMNTGAFLFVDFLNRNGRLLDTTGHPVINDIGLAALALLVAESDPTHKETMIRLVMNMLVPPT